MKRKDAPEGQASLPTRLPKEARLSPLELDDIPVEILAGSMVPFLSELETYCMTMTSKRYAGMGRHCRRPAEYVWESYPGATFWRLGWCPVCNRPYNRNKGAGQGLWTPYMHVACHREWFATKMWKARDGRLVEAHRTPVDRGLYFHGRPYTGLFFVDTVSAERALGVPCVRFWGHLDKALGAAQRAERHAHYKSYFAKHKFVAQVSPRRRVDVYRLLRTKMGDGLYQKDDPVGTARKAVQTLEVGGRVIQGWFERNVVPNTVTDVSSKCWVRWVDSCNNLPVSVVLHNIVKHGHDAVIQAHLLSGLRGFKTRELTADLFVKVIEEWCECAECLELTRSLVYAVKEQIATNPMLYREDHPDAVNFGNIVEADVAVRRRFKGECFNAVVRSLKRVNYLASRGYYFNVHIAGRAFVKLFLHMAIIGRSDDELEQLTDTYTSMDVLKALRDAGPEGARELLGKIGRRWGDPVVTPRSPQDIDETFL
jgi:hypothetical protein